MRLPGSARPAETPATATKTIQAAVTRKPVALLRVVVPAPLAALGVRWVVVQRVVGAPEVPAGVLDGLRLVHAGPDLRLYGIGASQRSY